MKLSNFLDKLAELAEQEGIAPPYIVGGFPRDRLLNRIDEINDIDITTGDSDSFALSLAANNVWPEATFQTFNDGHSSMAFRNMNVDFSNNKKAPGIEAELKKIGIENPSDLEKEVYSRDFTVNTLLQPMDLFKDIVDVTGKGVEDAKNGILRSPIDPTLTIGSDNKRILRAMKLAIALDFTIEESLEEAMIRFRGGVGELNLRYVKKQINQMFDLDPQKTVDLMSKYKLLPIVPLDKILPFSKVMNIKTQKEAL